MKRVLIANRGEIACRIIRACRTLGLQSVAVYSDADAGALHVEMADTAVRIGPAPARQSYLHIDAILDAARASRAEAVHPGYGFLSENAGFGRKVTETGLIFIGPEPDTIEGMGDKGHARAAAQAAGVPVLPGSPRFGAADAVDLDVFASVVGFPLLVKAAGGGGGIGMRRVDELAQLPATVAATQAQAQRTFGDGCVYLERFVARARHVEVQVFGLGDGRVATFPERDCSVQRRFQKVIEESGAPELAPETSTAMRGAAQRLAASMRFRGAGTVEFVVDADTNNFYFLEMNTRIQVEHPVTEMVADVDLVGLQLRLASGEALDALVREEVAGNGHAIEARIYAEAPERGFLPCPGQLTRVSLPAAGQGLRIESGVRSGDRITPYYDPMIAKVVAWGADRPAAIACLREALAAANIEGVTTNREFLCAVLDHAAFRAGAVTTDFVDAYRADLVPAVPPAKASATAVA